jgi:hypothetical protein
MGPDQKMEMGGVGLVYIQNPQSHKTDLIVKFLYADKVENRKDLILLQINPTDHYPAVVS